MALIDNSTATCNKNYAKIFDDMDSLTSESNQTSLVPNFLQKLIWNSGETVMDLGCGPGRTCCTLLAPKAAHTNSKIYGVDISESMIQYARRTYPHPNVEYVLGDLLAGPEFKLSETRFDKVFCIYTLRLILRKVDTLRKCYELLKPGGQLVIVNVVQATIFMELRRHIKKHPEFGSLLGKELADPHWYDDETLQATSTMGDDPVEIGSYHEAKYAELLTKLGFIVQENFTRQSVAPMADIKEAKEFAIAIDPHPHETYARRGGDLANLEAFIEEYFVQSKTQNVGGGRFDQKVTSIFIRAEKPVSGA